MQFSTLKSTFLAGALAIIGASAETTYRVSAEPVKFLNSNFYDISWVNHGPSSLFAGDAKTLQSAELFAPIINNSTGQVAFLSYHSERYVRMYVLEGKTGAVQVDEWQGIPRFNATQTGFTIDDDGYLGLNGDNSKWSLCPTGPRTYQLWFVDGGAPTFNSSELECIPTQLKTEVFGVCS